MNRDAENTTAAAPALPLNVSRSQFERDGYVFTDLTLAIEPRQSGYLVI